MIPHKEYKIKKLEKHIQWCLFNGYFWGILSLAFIFPSNVFSKHLLYRQGKCQGQTISSCWFYNIWLTVGGFSYRAKNTPMLLASSSGALECVCCLIGLGAEILRTNEKNHNLIHLAALRFHTNILEYFINHEHPGVSVWTVLVGKRVLCNLLYIPSSICFPASSSYFCVYLGFSIDVGITWWLRPLYIHQGPRFDSCPLRKKSRQQTNPKLLTQ